MQCLTINMCIIKKCDLGLECGETCISKQKVCFGKYGGSTVNILKEEGLPIATIKLGKNMHGAYVKTMASEAIKQAQGLDKIAKLAKGTIQDLKDIETGTQGDLFYSLVANSIYITTNIPALGDIVALQTGGKIVEALQNAQSKLEVNQV